MRHIYFAHNEIDYSKLNVPERCPRERTNTGLERRNQEGIHYALSAAVTKSTRDIHIQVGGGGATIAGEIFHRQAMVRGRISGRKPGGLGKQRRRICVGSLSRLEREESKLN